MRGFFCFWIARIWRLFLVYHCFHSTTLYMAIPTNQKQVLTKLKIRDSSIVAYPSYELFNLIRGGSDKSKENLKDNHVKGCLSAVSARKMRDLVQSWTNCIKANQLKTKKPLDSYISFITLTLPSPQMDGDKELKRKALDKFLIYLQRKYKVTAYVWKAEPQENGNLHFHILANKFVEWQEIRKTWNAILEPLGYIDQFFQKHGHRDPNSTDIHGLYKDKTGKEINFIGSYMAKYMAKNGQGKDKISRKIIGRVWGCSDNLKTIQAFSDYQDSAFIDLLNDLYDSEKITSYKGDFFIIFSGNWKEVCKKYPQIIEKINLHYLSEFEKTLSK